MTEGLAAGFFAALGVVAGETTVALGARCRLNRIRAPRVGVSALTGYKTRLARFFIS